ncbi:MAG: ABC transporter ATP-binding protein, partial [Lachnospiraceae bacterium]|nr:ABC transporter ATP-binding protein [Lachnospiraceae bacterium]
AENAILHDISVEISKGESVAILGANGSGKTTFLRALNGVLPYLGSIQVEGKEVKNLKRKKLSARMDMMTQMSNLYFSYTVEETVLLGRYVHTGNMLGIPNKEDYEIVDQCLEQNGLKDIRKKQIGSLSGGQMQRVFLARTMAQQAPILLLDEPTNHLDLKYQAELVEFLQKWKTGSTASGQDGDITRNTLVGVYHDINLAFQVADRFLFMKQGHLIADLSKEDVRKGDILKETYGIDVVEYMQRQLENWK